MKTRKECVLELFNDYNCCQSVFAAFADQTGMDKKTGLLLTGGFGGGMGTGNVCGAVTASYMVIGLKHGHSQPGDTEGKAHTKALIQKFNAAFVQRHGSILCKALIDADLSTESGQAKANKNDVFNAICPQLLESATELLEKEF